MWPSFHHAILSWFLFLAVLMTLWELIVYNDFYCLWQFHYLTEVFFAGIHLGSYGERVVDRFLNLINQSPKCWIDASAVPANHLHKYVVQKAVQQIHLWPNTELGCGGLREPANYQQWQNTPIWTQMASCVSVGNLLCVSQMLGATCVPTELFPWEARNVGLKPKS